MEAISLSKLISNAYCGIISRNKFFEKICRGMYDMLLIDCPNRVPGSMYESMDKIMECTGWSSQGYDVCCYGDLVSFLADPQWKDTSVYYSIIKELGQLMSNISAHEKSKRLGGLF